jgi:hypothetical protein
MFLFVASVADASRFGLLRVADPSADLSPSDRELGHESSRTLLDEEFEAYVLPHSSTGLSGTRSSPHSH